ncbi:MAG: hypothetical protein K5655_07105 [Lachnospiraceae bacterium]|nr:hypothetical protein [Lachnospiraceae bacterium]
MSDKNALNGAELTKTADPVVIETLRTEESVSYGPMNRVETMVSGYGVMTGQEATLQASFLERTRQDIAEKYKQKRIDASMKEGMQPRVKTVAIRAVDYSLPKEPELSDKERKNKRKELAKKKKKAMKENDKATEYSLDILTAQEERNHQIVLQKQHKQMSLQKLRYKDDEEIDEAQKNKIEHVWEPLSVFAPKIKLKKNKITPQSAEELDKYFSRVEKDTDKMIKAIKKKMFEENVNPNKFTPEYVGGHFEEMRDQVDRLRAYVRLFGEKSPEYEELNVDEKAYVRQLAVTAELAGKALVECANMHGVHIEDGEEKSNLHGLPNSGNCLAAKRELQAHLDSRDVAVKNEADRILTAEYDKLYDKAKQFFSDIAKASLKDEGKTERYSYINIPLMQGYHYDAIDETVRKIDALALRFPEKYEKNKEKIAEVMGEFLRSVQLQSEYSLSTRIYDMISSGSTIKETPEGLEEAVIRENYEDRYAQRRYAAESDKLSRSINMVNWLSEALQYLAGGQVPSETACRILKAKGIAVPEFEEKVTEAQKSAKMFLTVPAEKKDLFKTLFLEKSLREEGGITEEKKTEKQKEKDRERILGNPLLHKEPLATLCFGLKIGQPYINEMMVNFAWDYIELDRLKNKQKEGKTSDEERAKLAELKSSVAREMQDVLGYLIKEIKEFNMPWLKEGNPDVMREHAEELLEMSQAVELIKILGKQKDVEREDDPDAPVLLDSLLGLGSYEDGLQIESETRERRESILAERSQRVAFDRKLEMIKGGVMKARAASLLHLYTLDKLDESYIETVRVGKSLTGTVSEGDILKLAKDMYNAGAAVIAREERRFFSDKVVQDESKEVHSNAKLFEESVKSEVTAELLDVTDYMNRQIAELGKDKEKYPAGISKAEFLKQWHRDLKSELDETETQIEQAETEEEKEKLRERRKAIIEKMEDAQMVYGLSIKRFELAGGDGNGKMAAIFRSLPSMDACGTFDSLTKEEYRELLLDLTAGAFLTGQDSKKDIEVARFRNVLGIKKYLTLAANRYEKLIAKYGDGKPDFVYIFEHRDEISKEASLAQEDGELIIKFPEAFDEKSAEDTRVINLIKYGTALSWSMAGMLAVAIPTFRSGQSVESVTEMAWKPEKMEQGTLNELTIKDKFRRKYMNDDREKLRPQATALFEEAARKAREKGLGKDERGSEQ